MKKRLLIGGVLVFACLCVAASVGSQITDKAINSIPTMPPIPTAAQAAPTPQPASSTAVLIGPTETALPPTESPPTAMPTAPPPTLPFEEGIARAACREQFVSIRTGANPFVVCNTADNLTTNLILAGTVKRFRAIVKIMDNKSVKVLLVQFQSPFVDKYGNSVTEPSLSFVISRPLYDKINWDRILDRDLAKLLTNGSDGGNVVVHPAVQEDWIAYIKG